MLPERVTNLGTGLTKMNHKVTRVACYLLHQVDSVKIFLFIFVFTNTFILIV